VTRMVAAQFAPVPSRRKRGGLPAGCSAIILVWALALVPPALAVSQPSPDAMPQVHPDAAPVKNPLVRVPASQEPASKQPAAQTPSTEQPAARQPATQQPAPTRQPASTGQPAVTTRAATARTHAAAPRAAAHRTAVADRAKDRRTTRPDAAASRRAAEATVRHRRDVFVAARQLTHMLTFATPHASNQPRDDGPLLAGAALLLLVGAAGSVLRLSARMSGDVFRGRPG
jgi:hypothetical protein